MLIQLIPFIVLVMILIKLEWGMIAFILYFFILPLKVIFVGGLMLPYNTFFLAMILSFIIRYHNKDYYDFTPIRGLVILYALLLLVIPIEFEMPISMQIKFWASDFLPSLVVPFVIWNIIVNKPVYFKIYSFTLLLAIIVAVVYGLILTQTYGLNPYLMYILPLSGGEFNQSYAAGADAGRLFGRISSVYQHPMTFALVLSLSFIYVFFLKFNKIAKSFYLLAISMIIIMCGVRTPIVVVMLCLSIYVLTQDFKLGFKIFLGLFVVFMLVSLVFPTVGDYVMSLFSSKGNVSGSSLSLRIEQFQGCIDIIKGNPFLGNGYRWPNYYMMLHGDHPVVLAFESLIFVIFCSWGFYGCLVWGLSFWSLSLNSIRKYKKDSIPIILIIISYLSYSVITGEYMYMQYFVIFYILIYSKSYLNTKNKILCQNRE